VLLGKEEVKRLTLYEKNKYGEIQGAILADDGKQNLKDEMGRVMQ